MVAGSNLIAPSKSANIESPTVPGFCQGFQLGIMHQSSSLHSAERLRLTALISPGGKSPFSLREWNAQAYRVMVVDDGFALNGKTSAQSGFRHHRDQLERSAVLWFAGQDCCRGQS